MSPKTCHCERSAAIRLSLRLPAHLQQPGIRQDHYPVADFLSRRIRYLRVPHSEFRGRAQAHHSRRGGPLQSGPDGLDQLHHLYRRQGPQPERRPRLCGGVSDLLVLVLTQTRHGRLPQDVSYAQQPDQSDCGGREADACEPEQGPHCVFEFQQLGGDHDRQGLRDPRSQ